MLEKSSKKHHEVTQKHLGVFYKQKVLVEGFAHFGSNCHNKVSHPSQLYLNVMLFFSCWDWILITPEHSSGSLCDLQMTTAWRPSFTPWKTTSMLKYSGGKLSQSSSLWPPSLNASRMDILCLSAAFCISAKRRWLQHKKISKDWFSQLSVYGGKASFPGSPIKDYSSFFCCAQLLSSFQYITHNFHHRYDHLCYNTHNPDKCWCRFIHYVHCNQRPFYSIFIFQDIPQKSLLQSTITIIFYCRYHISYFPYSLKMD